MDSKRSTGAPKRSAAISADVILNVAHQSISYTRRRTVQSLAAAVMCFQIGCLPDRVLELRPADVDMPRASVDIQLR